MKKNENNRALSDEELLNVSGGTVSGGTYEISRDCIGCGYCEWNCPLEAINRSTEGEWYTIDASKCINCGACIDLCPVGAIQQE